MLSARACGALVLAKTCMFCNAARGAHTGDETRARARERAERGVCADWRSAGALVVVAMVVVLIGSGTSVMCVYVCVCVRAGSLQSHSPAIFINRSIDK